MGYFITVFCVLYNCVIVDFILSYLEISHKDKWQHILLMQ
jgi:hypothetical protein